MRLLFFAAILLFTHFSFGKKKEIEFTFEQKVDSLVVLADSLLNSPTILGKIHANENYKRILESILKDSLSIFYDFSRVPNLSVVTENRNHFRIYTWTVRVGNSEFDYFGFTQFQRKRQKRLFGPTIIENYIHELHNKSSKIGDDELKTLDASNWWGCVYYELVPSPKRKDKSYLIIGWDGFGYRSTKKIIETLKFNNKGVPTFGHKILRYDNNHGTKSPPKFVIKSRIIFEFSGKVTMSCSFNPQLNMVVFDHLAPSNPSLARLKFTYAPDFTYDGLTYSKKTWIYKRDLDVRNLEDVKATKWKPKDTKNRTIDTLIPMRN